MKQIILCALFYFQSCWLILVSHFSSLFDSKMIFGFNEFPNHRFPLTGTIDEIGMDIEEIKDMGVDHIVFVSYSICYNFVPIGRDVDKMSLSKLLDRASKLL